MGWKDTNDEWNPRCAPLGGNSVWSVAGSPLPLDYTAAKNGNGEDGETPANGTRTNATSGVNGASKGIAGRAVAGSGYTIDTVNGVDSAYKGLK